MRATFEEKTYENYFNSELAQRAHVYFPLGQVQEGCLGFDSSSFSSKSRFWRMFGYPFWFFLPFKGVELREIADEMEKFLSISIDNMPQIKANLLFQYKKPEYITTSRGSEWTHWNEPYYRYNIYTKQQNLLLHIDKEFNSKILIVYASPALHDVHDLVSAHINKEIINISNFCKASEISHHGRNTYTQSGRYSIACSEPEKIEKIDLIKTIESLNTDSNRADENNRAFIVNFRKRLISLMSENQFYSASFNKLNEQYSEIEEYELFYSHLVLMNFRMLTAIQWLVKL